ncbi:MAG: hypothetical protein GY778_12805, partial [bacterium]|nr:hypothetical protein [bacterium]
AIHVEIVPGSSVGTLDLLNREFTTQDLYAIHFAGDLSIFGLVSPVILPGSSAGTISFDADGTGHISMAWDGESELDNPADPSNPIGFRYTCDVSTVFAPAAMPLLSLGLVPELLNLALTPEVEGPLLSILDSAQFRLDQGRPIGARMKLNHFVRTVDGLRGSDLSDEQADLLTDKADTVLDLIVAEMLATATPNAS